MLNEAAEILARAAAAYASCGSYRDEGVVKNTYFGSGRVQHLPFSTRFVRGNGFRFEFRSRHGEQGEWNRYVVWEENGLARTWWGPGHDETGSLSLALAGVTGVSGGSGYRVPHLLMPELGVDPLAVPHGSPAKLLDLPEAEGCFVIEQARGPDTVEQIWLDRPSLLIRRVVQPRHWIRTEAVEAVMRPNTQDRTRRIPVRGFEIEMTTVYDAAFDVTISPDELAFEPPKWGRTFGE